MRDYLLVACYERYAQFCGFLYRLGAPAWVVNLPGQLVPSVLLRACARAYFRSQTGGAQ